MPSIHSLAVEDDKLFVDLLKSEVKKKTLPFTITWAKHGEQAVKLVRDGHIYDVTPVAPFVLT